KETQGGVDAYLAPSKTWRPAYVNLGFCFGDMLQTGPDGRALLAMPNETFIRVRPNSKMRLIESPQSKPGFIGLLEGFLYFISRTPYEVDVNTPFVNAVVKGTEFSVEVTDTEARITVVEGEVLARNEHGQVSVGNNQMAVARKGQAPQLKLNVNPDDAVQWTLHFPPVFSTDPGQYRSSLAAPALTEALGQYREGHVNQALATLEGVPQESRDRPYLQLRSGLLLSVGRVEEARTALLEAHKTAPDDADIEAQLAVMEVARKRKEQALQFAAAAVRADPASPAARKAASYAYQARFNLDKAAAAARKVTELTPQDATGWARLAELELARGHRQEARKAAAKAAALAPERADVLTVQGFLLLDEGDPDAARATFQKAVAADSSDPLARFGLGLARINGGELDAGTADLSEAAGLDTRSSLIRSYLGKAYFEQKRGRFAETQFDLAKRFDPKDPTPWFYGAIHNHTVNRPVEALADMQQAIKLNGNRAVYRSKQLLDSDLAARGAAIGRIYNELGFGPRAAVEAWQSLADDPGDYTAHRLLSDSLSSIPRTDLARTSELLQSQLLQSLNITPIQPRLAESNLFLVGNLGPSALSLNEFNPLFNRNRFTTLISGQVGSNDTYADELVHAGLYKNLSYSLGQFHYQTAGYKKNDDIDANVYNAFVQGRITPDFSVQGEYRHRDVEHGYLNSSFFPIPEAYRDSLQAVLDNTRQQTHTDTYRLGFNWAPTEHSKLLGSYIHLEQSAPVKVNPYFLNLPGSPPIPVEAYHGTFFARGDSGEVQHLYSTDRFKSILGGGFSQVDANVNANVAGESTRQQQGNGYLYTDIGFPASVKWTLGGSFDVADDRIQPKIARAFNPKGGVMWQITPDTLLRAAAFRTMRRFMLSGQTLEPTQVAGFNQFYDDRNQSRATRFGLGLDQRFANTLTGGIELSERKLEVPYGDVYGHWRETQYRGYLLWTLHPRWSATLEYYREDFTNLDLANTSDVNNTWTQYIPVTLAYFDPSGFFARFKATHYRQEVANAAGDQSRDYAEFLALGLGYRLPQRLGLFELQFQNLLDQHYRYEGLGNRVASENLSGGVPPYLPFPPEFTVSARLTLAF
ncbi:MAG: tetratricopeptide repeat protein, partial [Methylococcaceae bacterium]|nr:tetratricopeptide repeat protein [Methylococcaceae bacterium]